VQRFGATKGKATNILKAFLIDAATPTSGTISKAMNLSMLADAYLKLKEDTGRAPRTISTYRHNIESIISRVSASLLWGRLQRCVCSSSLP